MSEAECSQKDQIDRINKAIFGNGRPGLIEVTAVLSDNVNKSSETHEDLTKAINGIHKFMAAHQAKEIEAEKYKDRQKWFIGALVSINGILLTVIGFILNK